MNEKWVHWSLYISPKTLYPSLCTEEPVMTAEGEEWWCITNLQISVFSAPQSVLILFRISYNCVAFVKQSRTVTALLLLEHLRKTTVLENPSMPPCTTRCQRIILWLPSMCQTALVPFELYALLLIAILCRREVLIGSTWCIDALRWVLWTLMP